MAPWRGGDRLECYRFGVAGRSSFGATQRLPGGRWKAWYVRDGMRHTPGRTFPNKLQADAWLKEEEELLLGGKWTDRRRKTTLNQFVEETWWPRKDLAPRTREEYADVLRLWIYAPVERRGRPPLRLGEMPIAQIGEDDIVTWYNASRARQHPARLAKAYRLAVRSHAVRRRKACHRAQPSSHRGRGLRSGTGATCA